MKQFRIKLNFLIVLIAVMVLLIFFHYVKILAPIENLIIRIFNPIQSTVYSAATSINDNFLTPRSSAFDLEQENQKLKGELDKLILENVELKTYKDENTILSEQLKLVESLKQTYVSCKVISKNLLTNENILVLNCGSSDGLQIGLPAIVSSGAIIGKIIEVEPRISRLLLINDSLSKLGATILNERNTIGIVRGDNELGLKMEYIPRDIEIKKLEIIVTSALEKNVQPNLVIGRVEDVFSQDNNFFQTAIIKPIVNFENIKIVSIILPPGL